MKNNNVKYLIESILLSGLLIIHACSNETFQSLFFWGLYLQKSENLLSL